MIVASDLPKLSKIEKLTMMELLWSDLTSSSDEPESPPWHSDVLEETACRYKAGQEPPVSWSAAKDELLSERR